MEWLDRGTEVELEDDSASRSHHLPHLGEILQDMHLTLFPKKNQTPQERQEALRQFEKGFVFEKVMGRAFMERQLGRSKDDLLGHDTEIEYDGVLLNPDDVNLIPNELEEYKGTARSMLKFEGDGAIPERDFAYWFWQMMGYCKAKKLTRARLVVLWLCGDYRPPFPRIRTYRFRWTQAELDENWQSIKAHLRWMKERGGK